MVIGENKAYLLDKAIAFEGETSSVGWDNITGKPDSYPPETHIHSQSDISGLSSALSGKANSSHTHSASQVTAGTFAGNVVARSGGAVGIKMVRNIYAGTSDIGAGAILSTGDIYLVYE